MSVFENDFIMRQIEDMTGLLGKVFLHKQKKEELEEEELNDENAKKYLRKIKERIANKDYKEAMKILHEEFMQGNVEYLRVALFHFDLLNALSDAELKAASYSRNDLYYDLQFISELYGIHL